MVAWGARAARAGVRRSPLRRFNRNNMSLPESLRTSVTPPELEFIACQQLIEIVPLISLDKTVFISVP